ncbi:hypothetical protein [Haliscomenobacter hydrossis]|uniref:Uncharacterized protein n=1 Tax=Haliscomenobacter hydrossis (strain ATCC 27775 / DSM 1100 / LMG 10767 / O) TaxID=760192 RepID=F4KU11_HALH1|nr:hypothetical protein [Haliscomenobacter hydrossis]AEE49147.1 hypothetical protein Halhy_1252 [Haliscomenobacter hydrossis DSM 1100]
MIDLIDKNWDYIFSQDGDDYFLDVVCGTVAVFTIQIKLDEVEKAKYLEKGEAYLDELAGDVRWYPAEYLKRRV